MGAVFNRARIFLTGQNCRSGRQRINAGAKSVKKGKIEGWRGLIRPGGQSKRFTLAHQFQHVTQRFTLSRRVVLCTGKCADPANPFRCGAPRERECRGFVFRVCNRRRLAGFHVVRHGPRTAAVRRVQCTDLSLRRIGYNQSERRPYQGIYTDRHGWVWVGTPRGINRYAPAAHAFKRFYSNDTTAGDWSVYHFFEDLKGTLWAGSTSGLFRYIPDRDVFEKQPVGCQRACAGNIFLVHCRPQGQNLVHCR